jgi:hypothetical protein
LDVERAGDVEGDRDFFGYSDDFAHRFDIESLCWEYDGGIARMHASIFEMFGYGMV